MQWLASASRWSSQCFILPIIDKLGVNSLSPLGWKACPGREILTLKMNAHATSGVFIDCATAHPVQDTTLILLVFRYTGHHFLSTLLYSVFLGVVAVDRFCLGYSAIAVGKLMTLGGLGVWWIIDIFLLVTGNLAPADDSNWEPYY